MPGPATWQDALDYLYGLTNWETRPPGTRPTFELDRIRAVLAELGDPHHRWPAVHVGGTNGKGSTCAMIASGLRAAGYRVGLFTSPHLHTVRERIQVDGELVGEDEVLSWLARHRAMLDRHAGLTTFEALTALAFDHFAERAVDIAVIEVGLGGRIDTTNVVRPAITVLTPIGLDHTAVLGPTVGAIAADKAGILKPGVPAASAPQVPAARAAIAAEAEDLGVPVLWVGEDVRWREGAVTPWRQEVQVAVRLAGSRGRNPPDQGATDDLATAFDLTTAYDLATALVGPHQVVNAATAVAALAVLDQGDWAPGRPVPAVGRAAIERGLAEARWPARFECFGDAPGTGPRLVADGAHNPPAAAALKEALAAVLPAARRHFILGFSGDKDVGGIVDALLPGAAAAIVTRSSHVRAMAVEDAMALVARSGIPATAVDTPAAALAQALATTGPGDVVVATGSIFLAADVRLAWFARAGLPPPPHDPPRPE